MEKDAKKWKGTKMHKRCKMQKIPKNAKYKMQKMQKDAEKKMQKD